MRDFSGIAQPEIFTLHDLVHRLTLRTGSTPTDRTLAMFSRAIQDAIRGLPGKHDWRYFNRQSRFVSSASVDLSISYDHTGGAHERLVTVTDGALPADASFGELRIGESSYRVMNRITDSLCTLEPDFCLTEDMTGGATWTRRAYQFSREMLKINYVRNITRGLDLSFLPSSLTYTDSYHCTGYPHHFTYQNHNGSFGVSEFILTPSPTLSEVYEVSGTVSPLIPRINYISGTNAAATIDSDTVTSASASFDKSLVGTVFRLSRDSTPPTGYNYEDWYFQAFVVEVTNATTLKLSELIPETVTGRGYSISSPIDAESSVMLEYLEDEAYHQYTKNHDHKTFPIARKVASESLRMAVARDNRISLNSYLWRDSDIWGYIRGGFISSYPCLCDDGDTDTPATTTGFYDDFFQQSNSVDFFDDVFV